MGTLHLLLGIDNSIVPWTALLGAAVVLFILQLIILLTRHKHKLPLPPVTPSDAITNLKKKINQSSIDRFTHAVSEYAAVKASHPEFDRGGAFRMKHIPFLTMDPIYVTDYQLARTVLLGSSERGIPEGVKKTVLSSFNLTDRRISNIFTAASADPNREKARKFIAPAFSTTNLSSTLPCLNRNLSAALAILNTASKSGTVVDLKPLVLALLMETLTESAFGINFRCSALRPTSTADNAPTDEDDFVDGDAFLKDLDFVIRERATQSLLSVRKYMFWEKNVRECESACARLEGVASQVLSDFRNQGSNDKTDDDRKEKKEKSGAGAAGEDSVNNSNHSSSNNSSNSNSSSKQSIMSRIVQHAYPSDRHRLSEILVLVMAGHETTAYSLCFLLAAVAQRPDVQRKLQQELDTIKPVVTTATTDAAASTTAEAGANESVYFTMAEASKAEYLQWCIFESMRLWPVAPGSARTLLSDIEYKGMVLPKGHVIIPQFYPMFREDWIDRPNEFIPERWSETSAQSKELKEMLMPFSLGKRGCVGQNMAKLQLKLISANLFRCFDFVLQEEVRYETFLTMKVANLNTKVTARV